MQTVWETVAHFKARVLEPASYEDLLGECVNNVLKRSLLARSEDNVTVIMICFINLLE